MPHNISVQKIIFYITLFIFCFVPGFTQAKIPNDPHVEQWSYEHTGVYDAWDYTTGSKNVTVAILDNGFDTFHPDLIDNVWKNEDEIPRNEIDDDNNGYIDDVYGWNFYDDNNNPRPNVKGVIGPEKEKGVFNHGTLVAGIIGAKGDNNRDGAGLNWNAKLMNVKVLGNRGSGDLAPLAEAIYYAVDNGADILNISMVGTGGEENVTKAVKYAYENNVLVVGAVGNTLTFLNDYPKYPACSDMDEEKEKVLGVSAIEESHRLASFSNTGSKCIDITAPGMDIHSTLRFSPNNGFADTYSLAEGWNGTSFAAPFISGAAALIKGLQPSWGSSEIVDVLLSTVHHTPGQNEEVYANLFGAGLLQVDKAVKKALNLSNDESDGENQSSEETKEIITKNISDKSLLFLDPNTGEYEERDRGKEKVDIKKRAAFNKINNIESSSDNNLYITVKPRDEETQYVSVYGNDWKRIYRWNIISSGSLDVVSADVIGDSQPEVIISPQYRDTNYAWIYDLDGTLVGSYEKSIEHDGSYVEVIYNKIRQKYDIVLSYLLDSVTYVEKIDGGLTQLNIFDLDGIMVGGIEAGDVDSDGVEEYLLSSRPGKNTKVFVVEQNGDFYMSFRVYPARYRGGVDVEVLDYNKDGQNEIVCAPQSPGQPIRVFNKRGKLIEEWWPLNSDERESILILPLK